MHILVIPSEEYIPAHEPLAGIFQHHQISVLSKNSDHKIGILSVRLKISLPMILKAMLLRSIAKRVSNELKTYSLFSLLRLAYDKLFCVEKYVSYEKENDVNIVRIEGLYYIPPSNKTDHISWCKSGLAAFKLYINKYGLPDIVHAHNTLNAGLLAYLLKQKYGVNYLLTEHSSYYYQGMVPEILLPKIKRAIRAASCFTVVSPSLKDILTNKLGKVASSAMWLPNVLPPKYELQSLTKKKETNNRENKYIFLSVGNMLPVKGHEFVIRAFALIVQKYTNSMLRLVGDGPLKNELEVLAKKLNIEDKVVFTGEVDSDSVRKEMLNADVFVFPSRSETFGVALIEAMSCGLPVVSTACGGPEEIVDDNTGILVEPENVGALQIGMEWAIVNVNTMDPQKIRENVIKRFGSKQFLYNIENIYEIVFHQNKLQRVN